VFVLTLGDAALLRLLNERKTADGLQIPLCTAIATANPSRSDYYNEPLDPANLDRFALQLCTNGLVHDEAWSEAAQVISGNLTTASGNTHIFTSLQEDACKQVVDMACVHDALPWVQLPRQVIAGLVELLRRLVEIHGCNERNSFLTDRTFLVKAPRIMQARALLSGRRHVTAEDLRVLSYMTTYRVPANVHKDISAIIDSVISEMR
jgi:MoxR-like ATPase